MSQMPPENPQAPNPAMSRRRAASVNLRGQTDSDERSLMDPANQALADALRITYRLLQVAMFALVVAYAFSAATTIAASERGLRLSFGQIDAEELEPGFALSLPRPLGEIVKVETGEQTVKLNNEFTQGLTAQENAAVTPIDKLAPKSSLDPIIDGSLITGDLNIAHARVTITYRRADVRRWAMNVDPGFEANLVRAAVMNGMIHAVGRISIDELLKNQPDAARTGPFPAVELTARLRAQETLDALSTGIRITSLTLNERAAPPATKDAFNSVEAAQSKAKAAAEGAQQARLSRLSATAGEAAPVLLSLIDRYERALAASESERAQELLRDIESLLEGRPITLEGQPVTVRVSGRAAGVLADAQQYRSSIVSRAQGDARLFEAKLASYRANPRAVLTGDWADAFAAFSGRETVSIFGVPASSRTLQVQTNIDPDIARELESLRQRRDIEAETKANTAELQRRQDSGN
jgi:regulator of protease activity HflC (stomatin/prohibitin superfamily)